MRFSFYDLAKVLVNGLIVASVVVVTLQNKLDEQTRRIDTLMVDLKETHRSIGARLDSVDESVRNTAIEQARRTSAVTWAEQRMKAAVR